MRLKILFFKVIIVQEHEELIKYKDNHYIKDHANHYNELLKK